MTRDITLHNEKYTIGRYNIDRAGSVFDNIFHLFGGTLVKLLSTFLTGDGKNIKEIPQDKVEEAFTSMATSLKDGDTSRIIHLILDEIVHKGGGGEIDIDEIFQRKGLLHLFGLCREVVTYNFNDFFSLGSKQKS